MSSSSIPSATPSAVMEQARRPVLIGVAAAALGVQGLLVCLLGLQNLVLVRWYPPFDLLVYGLLAAGALAVAAAVRVVRVSTGAHFFGLVVAALHLGVTGSWLVLSFANGVFSALAVAAAVGAMVALSLLATSLSRCKQTEAARAELAREGIVFNL